MRERKEGNQARSSASPGAHLHPQETPQDDQPPPAEGGLGCASCPARCLPAAAKQAMLGCLDAADEDRQLAAAVVAAAAGAARQKGSSRVGKQNAESHLQRLAAAVADVGKRRIFLDPLHLSAIAGANSRRNIKKMIADNIIVVKPEVTQSV